MVQKFANHKHWNSVKDVCRALQGAGFKAYLAGGCVRDLLMGREPHDFDVATDATPDQIGTLFPKALMLGRVFGVTMLPFSGFNIEVATFREDLEYKDGRRPEGVRFSTPEADAQRRDFTINALFLDPESGKVLDFIDGEKDIPLKLIRAVGDPHRRFAEDRLRLLRAVRFAAQLEFSIVPETLKAIVFHAAEIRDVSHERIRDEIIKLLRAPARLIGLELLMSTGLMSAIFPTLASKLTEKSAEVHKAWQTWFANVSQYAELVARQKQPQQIVGQWAEMELPVLLSLFFLPMFQKSSERDFRDQQLRELRLENKLIEQVCFILRHQPEFANPSIVRRGEFAMLVAHDAGPAAMLVASIVERSANAAGQSDWASATTREQFIFDLIQVALSSEARAPQPYLSGTDLHSVGVAKGPRMGELLHEAFLLQLEGVLKSRDQALEWLRAQAL